MHDSERYEGQAKAVRGMAARSASPAEREIYMDIAEGWTRLAAEAVRIERRERPTEPRSFHPLDPGGPDSPSKT